MKGRVIKEKELLRGKKNLTATVPTAIKLGGGGSGTG